MTHGYGDGTFRPNQDVTWVQMAAFLVRAFDAQPATPGSATSTPTPSTATPSTPWPPPGSPPDQAGPDSAGAQFFLTTGPDTSLLDFQGTYVVFGDIDADGLVVAQSIIGLHVETGNLGGPPSRDVTVRSVTIEETPAAA